jgi:hypothetical protein
MITTAHTGLADQMSGRVVLPADAEYDQTI